MFLQIFTSSHCTTMTSTYPWCGAAIFLLWRHLEPECESQLSIVMFDPVFINMEEAGIRSYTTASHQGVIKMIWFHFWGAVMSAIFICGLLFGGALRNLRVIIHLWWIKLLSQTWLLHRDWSKVVMWHMQLEDNRTGLMYDIKYPACLDFII